MIHNILVVSNPKRWRIHPPGTRIVSARDYITRDEWNTRSRIRVFNLSNSFRYQSMGYYVSLLAAARGHRPSPGIETIQDMKSLSITRLLSDDIYDLIQKSLKPLASDEFVLSIYFGQNMAKRYAQLSRRLFNLFPAPLLRAEFRRVSGEWMVHRIRPLPSNEIPEDHLGFVEDMAAAFFSAPVRSTRRSLPRYHIAILHNPEEPHPPSDERVFDQFSRQAHAQGIAVETITRDEYETLSQYDGLWIRETTNVNHHTYRFSRRAAAEGLVVIDDPRSIQLCTNKVFLAELLQHHRIAQPETAIVYRGHTQDIEATIGFPCILKMPDSSFSQGVFKAETAEQFDEILQRLLKLSELVIVQEYLPTPFDWRVGVLDRKPLYACKYFMAKEHWQIQKNEADGNTRYGDVESIPLDQVPPSVMRRAVRAANLIGDGLYGVDLKQIGARVLVIEINDNPSIDSGYEDKVPGKALYETLVSVFLKRMEQSKRIT